LLSHGEFIGAISSGCLASSAVYFERRIEAVDARCTSVVINTPPEHGCLSVLQEASHTDIKSLARYGVEKHVSSLIPEIL
jgi:hypothetical protein